MKGAADKVKGAIKETAAKSWTPKNSRPRPSSRPLGFFAVIAPVGVCFGPMLRTLLHL